jgi:hypothetical protein
LQLLLGVTVVLFIIIMPFVYRDFGFDRKNVKEEVNKEVIYGQLDEFIESSSEATPASRLNAVDLSR